MELRKGFKQENAMIHVHFRKIALVSSMEDVLKESKSRNKKELAELFQ